VRRILCIGSLFWHCVRAAFGRGLTIGLALGWGFLVNWVLAKFVRPEAVLSLGFLPFIAGYLASCIAGVHLFRRSDNPAVVLAAIRMTGLVTIVMMFLGAMSPASFLLSNSEHQ
jgi:hypothetical protein